MSWRKSAVVALLVVVASFVSITESKPRKSLRDYYQLMFADQQEALTIDEQESQDSYLKINAKSRSHIELSLFRGEKADLVMQQSVACGPNCLQSMSMVRFRGEKQQKIVFEDEIPKGAIDFHVNKLSKRLPVSSGTGGYQVWYRLSKVSRVVDVLIYDSNFTTAESPMGYLAGRMSWSGQKFRFRGLWPKKATEKVW